MVKARTLAACAALVALVSCGGGGGGGSSASVNTSQANISAGNVDAFVQAMANIAAVAISTRVGPGTAFPQSGIAGGTVTFPAASPGSNVTGTGTYSALNRAAGASVSGQVSVTSGSYGAGFIENLHFSFASLSYPPSTLVISGTIDLVWAPPAGGTSEYTMTFNATVTSGGSTIAILENFAVHSVISAGQESLLLSGKYTDASQGFVNVSTTVPMVFSLPGGPGSGVIVVTGANATATITYSAGGTASVVIS